MITEYEKVKKDFLSGRIKNCRLYFEDNKYYTEAGYCCIMLDNLDKAEKLFQQAKEYDVRADWGLFLLQLFRDSIKSFPTYFQIRNFLEIDLGLLLMYCKENYVAKLIKYADFMAHYNPECYKFIGRAFWANNFLPVAMFFLKKAKDRFYSDPELHYLLAYIYYHNDKNIKECEKSLKTCLEILPEYAPAKALSLIIKNKK